MAFEQSWAELSAQPLIQDGGQYGQIRVASTDGIKVRAKVQLYSNLDPAKKTFEVKSVVNETDLELGPVSQSLDDRSDLRAYTVAVQSNLTLPKQPRSSILPDIYNRAVYEEMPAVAIRSLLVDGLGNKYSTANPLPVRLSNGSVNIGTVNAELEVQLSHRDNSPNPGDVADSTRIGDGQEELQINPDGEATVHDQDVLEAVGSLNSSLVTESNQTQALLQAEFDQTQALLQAEFDETQTKQDAGNASLSSLDSKFSSLGQKTTAQSAPVVLASDQSPVFTRSANAIVSGNGTAANTDLFPSTDVSQYAVAMLQITGTFVGTITFQGSNDGTNFVSVNAQTISNGTTTIVQTATAAGMFKIPIHFRFLRIRMTAYTSGTAVGTTLLSSNVSNDLGQRNVAATQSGNWSVRLQDGSGNLITSAAAGANRPLDTAQVRPDGTRISPATEGTLQTEFDETQTKIDGTNTRLDTLTTTLTNESNESQVKQDATNTKLDTLKTEFDDTQTLLQTEFDQTQVKQDTGNASLASIDGKVATSAKQDTALTEAQGFRSDSNSRLGATNETAPANDTAASGLNGRLQRVAQNITASNTKLDTLKTEFDETQVKQDATNTKLDTLKTEFDDTQTLLQTEFDQTQTAIQSLQTEVDAAQYTMNEAFSKATAIGGQLDDVATTAATENNIAPARITPQRALHTNLRDSAGTEIGSANTELKVRDIVETAGVQGAISVSTTAVAVRVGGSNHALRKVLTALNNGTATLYWGYNNTVTVASGTPLMRNQFAVWEVGANVTIWIIAASGSHDLRVTEGS